MWNRILAIALYSIVEISHLGINFGKSNLLFKEHSFQIFEYFAILYHISTNSEITHWNTVCIHKHETQVKDEDMFDILKKTLLQER